MFCVEKKFTSFVFEQDILKFTLFFFPQDKKEYLEGLIDKIVVNFDKDTNEHSLDFRFKLALVNDGIEYKNATDKSVGYDIVEGEKSVEKIKRFNFRFSISRRIIRSASFHLCKCP